MLIAHVSHQMQQHFTEDDKSFLSRAYLAAVIISRYVGRIEVLCLLTEISYDETHIRDSCSRILDIPCDCIADGVLTCINCGCHCCGCSCEGCPLCLRNLQRSPPENENGTNFELELFYKALLIMNESIHVVPSAVRRLDIGPLGFCNCANGTYLCPVCNNNSCGCSDHPSCIFCEPLLHYWFTGSQPYMYIFGHIDEFFNQVVPFSLEKVNQRVDTLNERYEHFFAAHAT